MPTSMTLGQLTEPVQQAQSLPLQHGMQLAQAAQAMQQKQVETQKMQEDLDTQKWSSFKGMMDTYTKAAPAVQKAMKNQLGDRFKQIGADPTILDIVGDEDQANKWRQISGAFGNDPQAKAVGLQAMTNASAFAQTSDHAFETLDMQQKNELASKLANQKATTQIVVGQGHDEAKIGAAKIAGTNNARMLSSQTMANNAYSKQLGPAENALNQADRALGLVDKIDSGSLKSTKLLNSDLEAAQASLLGGGKPSTVYGQQAVHMDDVYSRAQNAIQFITSDPQNTQSKAKLDQLKLDLHALRDFYDEQHAQNYTSYREGVPEPFQPALDKRYQTFRKLHGLSEEFASAPGQMSAGAATGGAPKLSANQQTFMTKAKALVNPATKQPYSDADIQQMMQTKGIK